MKNLILRSAARERLEGWPRAWSLWRSFETALARLIQDEV
jgi:hypothetical protein